MKKDFQKYNCEKLVIKYKIFGKHNINDFLDKNIKKIANSCGLEFIGSGYDFETGERDLEFMSVFCKK